MGPRRLARSALRVVAADLREDRLLRYLLVLAALACGLWFWHRLPNVATRDEFSRLLDPLVAYGSVAADPSLAALREGVASGRVPFGATFYLFGLAALPAVVAAAVAEPGLLARFAAPAPTFGFYDVWQDTPGWFWTLSVGAVRLVNVATAVACVYLTYRIGTAVRDRRVGRLAALLLTLSFGFLTLAREGGEDLPAVLFVLLALSLLVGYVERGARWRFLAASAAGGVAIAFKLTAAPVVALVALAHLLRAHREPAPTSRALVRPRLLAAGAGLGLVAIALGFPTLLVGRADLVAWRVFLNPVQRATHQTGPDAPVWWWFLRGYLQAFGWPLFLATVGGTAATALRLRRRPDGPMALVAALAGGYLLLFVPWHDFRVHHLVPTLPLGAVLTAAALVRLRARWPAAGRLLLAGLVVTSAAYAGVGVAGYADPPRDRAVEWLEDHAEADDRVLVYRVHFQDTAVPHGMEVVPARYRGPVDGCPAYVQLGYRDLLYLVEGTYYRNGAAAGEYVRGLLDGERGYEVAAEFGPRPPGYVPDRPEPGSVLGLLGHGIDPRADQYADEQELAANQYTVILEHTGGGCDLADPF